MPDEALDAQRPMSGDASQTAGAGDRRGRVQEGVRTRLRELSWFLRLRERNRLGTVRRSGSSQQCTTGPRDGGCGCDVSARRLRIGRYLAVPDDVH